MSRLPTLSVRSAGGREATRTTGGDRVVAALHTKSGGVVAVASGFVVARGGRVVAMLR